MADFDIAVSIVINFVSIVNKKKKKRKISF